MQVSFRKIPVFQLLILVATVLLFGRWVTALPDRTELGPRVAEVRFQLVALSPDGFAPLRLAGAWEVTADDPRFGGVSALAVEGGRLIAITDSGAVIRFAKPGSGAVSASIRELPAGPSNRGYKSRRDSEGLLRDPRGWWVAFENKNQIWLYDRQFARTRGRIDFGRDHWPRNRGIEALASDGSSLLLFPERGETVVEVHGRRARALAIENPAGRISDAARLPSGELLILNRHPTALGFVSSIAVLERGERDFHYSRRIRLGVSPLDNVEALAPERLPDGGIRLWLMTDNNFQRPMRTLLFALDWPRRPQSPPASWKSRA